MKTSFRVFILITILSATVGLAQSGTAWAQPDGQNEPSLDAQGDLLTTLPEGHDHGDGGTVHPPDDHIKVCRKGNYSVGGVSVLKVKRLDPGYCVKASLQKRHETWGRLPAGGRILADITLFQVFYHNHAISSLPRDAGHVELCYAVPPDKNARIYYLDKHNVWKPMETTIKRGVACARVQTTGYYALIGK